ncbi:helix-turn-helix domain-containing protein [Brevibacillus choshinensis]|uniref:Helix-turn-helix domain-containing protein n=1 Tax=Brevibacillus choshinensis TaxID=54911 RepID=A0ABX7FS13_BRECH|nr:helix-turn-helix domain-containing protein [Brevibacillus choshinensis]QRG68891.1 helix-turn-helix domain-containing protein [Brevibacillus choshinensis]
MQNLIPIQAFLSEKLPDTPYQIWIGHPDSLELSFSSEQKKKERPLPPGHSPHIPYSFLQESDKAFFSVELDKDYGITICFSTGDASSLPAKDWEQLSLICRGLYYEEIHKPLKNDLEKMIDSLQMLTATLDVNDLLSKIIQIALTVIPAGDAGVFRQFDAKSQQLTPLTVVGLPDGYLQYKTRLGENVSGKVFIDKIPRLHNSTEEILSEQTNLSDENVEFVKKGPYAKGMIIVPVWLGEECIGTLAILQFIKKRGFTERDLKLLQGFSSQVAIAFHNAKLYKEAHMHLEESRQLSKELNRKNQLFQKRISVHETLTQLSLTNKGIHKMISEINRMLGRHVVYVDFLDTENFPGRRPSPSLSFDRIAAYFPVTQKSAVTATISSQEYYLYPIFIGKVLLGCMIVTLSHPLNQMDVVTIEQSGSVLALEMVKNISMTELYHKKAHTFFTQLLEKQDYEALLSKGLPFNFKVNTYTFVALCEIPGSFEPYEVEARVQRLLAKVNQRLSSINKLTFGFHNKITLLFSVNDAAEVKLILSQLEAIVREWLNTDKHLLYGGIGTPYPNAEEIAKSYEEAQKTLSFLINRNQSGLMRFEEIGINRFFLNQSSQDIERFTEEVFLPLRSDHAPNSDLETTLMLYVTSNQSAMETAKKLHIHINTLYQRLKRIEERLGLRLDHHEDMLKIQLACHLKNQLASHKR